MSSNKLNAGDFILIIDSQDENYLLNGFINDIDYGFDGEPKTYKVEFAIPRRRYQYDYNLPDQCKKIILM